MMCDRFAPGRSVIAPSRTAATSSNLLSLPKPLRGADPSLALPDAGMSQPHSPSRAVPSTCPKQRSATVIHGQQRSVAGAGELRHPRMLACRTVLPKLAVGRAGAATGPQRPERCGPRAAAAIICPAQQPSSAEHRRPRHPSIRSDMEGVTGSNPVAPAIKVLSSGNAGRLAVWAGSAGRIPDGNYSAAHAAARRSIGHGLTSSSLSERVSAGSSA